MHLKPVERIELCEGDTTKRIIGIVVCLALAVGFFAYGISQLVSKNSGWTQIEPKNDGEPSCASEFVFQYDLGRGESSATVEYKALSALYGQAAIDAYQTYHSTHLFEDRHNLAYLNAHPNEIVTVEDALYEALCKITEAENRTVFLAPVYAQYEAMFVCEQDYEAQAFDPLLDEDAADYVREALAFIQDPEAISLEVFSGAQARLNVSEAYLKFAEEYEIASLVDLIWMKNAFIADDLAQTIRAAGYTHGIVSSTDGFARRLETEESYSFRVLDRTAEGTYSAAVMHCGTADTIVSLRDYALNEQDTARVYVYEDGAARSVFVSQEDGLCHTACSDITAYSAVRSCAEVVLALSEVYVAKSLDVDALRTMQENGIETVFCEDFTIWHSETALQPVELFESETVRYTLKPLSEYSK